MRVLGIDFGTSNTVAMVRGADGRARPLLFDGSPLLPSSVYLDNDGRLLVGRDAERSARQDPARFEPNPKRRIDDGFVLLGDRELTVLRIFGAVLRRVAAEAQRQLGGPCQELRMTHPARWGERRRQVLIEAAREAGLPAPRLVAEPVAAASYYTAVLGTAVPVGRALAIYDLGGGTFDATVVRRTQTGFEVLAENGLGDLGGLDFDQTLVDHLGRGYAESRTQMWNSLVSPTGVGERRQRALLYEDVRGAKEMLSRTTSADVHVPALDISAHLTREELESLIRPALTQTVTCTTQTIVSARLTPSDLVGIFLVGGSSRIPLCAHLIHTELGIAPTTLEQPETVVAEGCLYFGAAQPATGRQGHSGVPRPVPAQVVRPPAQAGPSRMGPPPALPRPVSGPAGVRPASGAPVSPGVRPPRATPAARPGPLPPRMVPPRQAPQPVARPVNPPPMTRPTSPPHVTRPVPPMTGPPVMKVTTPARRSWYEEPGLVWTAVLGALVVIALIVLVIAANGN